jgi:NAD(P)-dependent dehydrogenase (short-subunit alcohol dehydrogenase family)
MSRTYVVTGSASGIGRAVVTKLEADGQRVVGVDVHDADIVADLTTAAGRAAIAADDRLVDQPLDGVIACAGLGRHSKVTSPEMMIGVNYFGAVATLESLRPLLARAEQPRAAVVASLAAIAPDTDAELVDACLSGDEPHALALAAGDGHRAYASSKRAIAIWMRRRAISPDWAGAGIPLNAVAPGIVQTPMSAPLYATPEARAATIARVPQPLIEMGRPEDIAALLVWLTSVENAFVCGQLLFADAGYEATVRGDQL